MTDTPDDFEWSDEAVQAFCTKFWTDPKNDPDLYPDVRRALKAAAKAQGLKPQPTQRQQHPSMQTCNNCRWWVSRPQYPIDGECRRYPPKLDVAYDPEGRGPTSIDQHTPTTSATWFCGEYTRHD